MILNPILHELTVVDPNYADGITRFGYRAGQALAAAGEPVEKVIFPSSGLLVSTLPLADGSGIEVGLYGRRGIVGGSAAFGATTHLTNCVVQIAGDGWSLPSAVLIEASRRHEPLQNLLIRHEQFMLFQAQQRAACNSKHPIHQRVAKRLLRASDICGEDNLDMTQEELASWLGVQRASLSPVAARLKDQGLIAYTRGRISLLNKVGLLAEACECCATLRTQADRLLPKHHGIAAQGPRQFVVAS